MTRHEILLAALASTDGDFTPVQIQKALFLLDKRASNWTGGPHFQFRAYDYGPFDASIYQSLSELRDTGLVEIKGDPTSKQRSYTVTADGRNKGAEILAILDNSASSYIREITTFVRSLGFAQLVSSIYRAYPEMRANSVFRG